MRVLPKRVASQYGFCPLCWTRFDERYQASVAVSSLQRPWSKPSGPQRIREKARALWHHKLLSCEPPRKPINLDPGFRASRCVEHWFHQHPSGFINQGHDQQAFMKSNNHLLSKTRQRFGSRFFSTTKRLNGVLLLQLSYIGGIWWQAGPGQQQWADCIRHLFFLPSEIWCALRSLQLTSNHHTNT